ncbi:MAG: hypothetical protein IPI43_08690 [Sandaracinaceae bacterium]|nr:hypothetical protein [Sandaracinaceae bacterium]
MNRGTLLAALTLSLCIAGCGGDGNEPLCTPGASVACVGTGGCSGGQVCNAEGTGFGACSCGPGLDGGTDAGGSNDGGTDDSGTDAAVGTCSLVDQTGCGVNQRCTWIEDDLGGGEATCESDGAIPLLGECVAASSGAPDACTAGHFCLTGLCLQLCSTVEGCGADFVCTRFVGFVDDTTTGVCVPRCDPVSQTRLHDDAPACGSPMPGTPTLGCYGFASGPFTCNRPAQGAATQTHGEVAVGPPGGGVFISGCAPGYAPFLGPTGYVCRAFCTPVETLMGNDAQRQGAAPHTCPARGAVATTEECRFLSFLADNPSQAVPGVGLCLDPTQQSYDHDQDPQTGEIPWPSCSTLTSPDHIAWGCAPPAP